MKANRDRTNERALEGLRVLVLRPTRRAGSLTNELEHLGAEVIDIPAVTLAPLADTSDLDSLIHRASEFTWVVFTSVTGVERVATRSKELGIEFAPRQVGAIGPATKEALDGMGLRADWMPSTYTTRAVGLELPTSEPGSVAVVRAASATHEMEELLEERGFSVERIDAYTTTSAASAEIAEAVASGVDAVVLTSPSIARSFAGATSGQNMSPAMVSIGPVTTEACLAKGIDVQVEAAEHTASGIVVALTEYFSSRRTNVREDGTEGG